MRQLIEDARRMLKEYGCSASYRAFADKHLDEYNFSEIEYAWETAYECLCLNEQMSI